MPLIRLLWVLLRLLLGVYITLMPLVSLIVDPSIPIPGIPSGIPSGRPSGRPYGLPLWLSPLAVASSANQLLANGLA